MPARKGVMASNRNSQLVSSALESRSICGLISIFVAIPGLWVSNGVAKVGVAMHITDNRTDARAATRGWGWGKRVIYQYPWGKDSRARRRPVINVGN